MKIWSAALLGAVGGVMLTCVFVTIRSRFGTFRIDRNDPEKDKYQLDLGDIEKLKTKRYAILRIDNNADLSPK